MDINNKEDLNKLLSFTFRITSDCPSDFGLECRQSNCHKEGCIYCWRNAVSDRINEIEKIK